MALDKVHGKARRIAAHHLDVPEDKIEFEDGEFRVVDSDRKLHFREVAEKAHLWNVAVPGEEPGLEAVARFEPEGTTYPFGAHVCQVEIDRDTGQVRLERYLAVDDCGVIINPLDCRGAARGGHRPGNRPSSL